MAAIMFQGPTFMKVGGSLDLHFKILDPSLDTEIHIKANIVLMP